MKERPILFSGPMVRAILDGRKTQTRRIMKPQPHDVPNGAYCDPYNHDYNAFTFWTADNRMLLNCGGDRRNTAHWRSPYGTVGDRLWVRETWRIDGISIHQAVKNGNLYHRDDFQYRADLYSEELTSDVKWVPSIHMPRWASRINLEITGVRVERLQDISEKDAVKEGIVPSEKDSIGHQMWSHIPGAKSSASLCSPRYAFANLINTVHGGKNWNFHYSNPDKYPEPIWDQNPWVWVIEFKKVEAS